MAKGMEQLYYPRKANKVFGVDIDKNSIEHARKTYTNKNIEFIEGSVTKIPIGDQFY